MTGTPQPEPGNGGDRLLAEAELLREEMVKTRKARLVRAVAIGVLAAVLTVFIIVFGLALITTHALSTQNRDNAHHLQSVVACLDRYDDNLAKNLRDRGAAAQRSSAALGRLIGQVTHLRTSQQFQADVGAYQRAVAAANRLPIPPLPPAACR